MKQELINCLTYLANRVAEGVVYKEHWPKDFRCKENEEAFDKVNDALAEVLDWDKLTEQDCKELRFGVWEKENPVRLIPIWLYKAIPMGTKLTSINGEEIVFDGNNIDTDTRFGCLAWGIIPKANN